MVAPPGCGKSATLRQLTSRLSSVGGENVPVIISGENLSTFYDVKEKMRWQSMNTMTFQLVLLENYMKEQEKIMNSFADSCHIIIEHTGLDTIQAFTKIYHRKGLLSDYNLNYISQQYFNTLAKLNSMEEEYDIRYIFYNMNNWDCESNVLRKRQEEYPADIAIKVCEYIRQLALGASDKNRLVIKYRDGLQTDEIIDFICRTYTKLKKERCYLHCVR